MPVLGFHEVGHGSIRLGGCCQLYYCCSNCCCQLAEFVVTGPSIGDQATVPCTAPLSCSDEGCMAAVVACCNDTCMSWGGHTKSCCDVEPMDTVIGVHAFLG